MLDCSEIDRIVADYATGMSIRQLACRYRHCDRLISQVLRSRGVKIRRTKRVKDPTPEEIQKGTLEVRNGWNEREYCDRCVTKPQLAVIPVYTISGTIPESRII